MKKALKLALAAILATASLSCGTDNETSSGFNGGKGNKPVFPPDSTETPGSSGEGGKTHLTSYTNPLYKNSTHADPSVIRVGDMFYSYATDNRIGILKSPDLVNWTSVGSSFTKQGRPDWAKNADGTSAYLWAPDINYIEDSDGNGQYVLYYSLAAEKYGIGVAVSPTPEGPFTDKGKLIQNGDIPGLEGCIDPCFFAENGHNYLIWGSHHGIFLTELTADGLKLKETPSSSSITKICRDTWEGPIIYKRGGYYYFFGSTGVTILNKDRTEADITYNVQCGRATDIRGPYLNKSGNSLMDVGTYQLLKGNDAFIGPGHNSEIIEDDKGQTWMLYHAFIKGSAAQYGRILCMDRVDWDENGWPVMNSSKGPSSTAVPAPWFD